MDQGARDWLAQLLQHQGGSAFGRNKVPDSQPTPPKHDITPRIVTFYVAEASRECLYGLKAGPHRWVCRQRIEQAGHGT